MRTKTPEIVSATPRHAGVLAASMVLLGLGAGASAQVQADQGGGALDANTRVGSNRANAGGAVSNQHDRFQRGNNIVDGNISGGAAFRGFVPYRAPTDFRDLTAGYSSSRFAGNSAGVTTGGQLISNASSVHSYYGPAQTVNAPSGFVRAPGSGGYIPPRAIDGGAARIEGRIDENLAGQRDREIDPLAGVNLNEGPLEAPVDPPQRSGADVGVNGRNFGQPQSLLLGDRYDYQQFAENAGTALSPYTRLRRNQETAVLDAREVRRLREELLRDAEGNRLAPGQLDALVSGTAPGSLGGQQSGQAGADERTDPTRNPVELEGIDSNERLRLASPAEQSALFAQLEERLHRFDRDPDDPALRPRMDEDSETAQRLRGLMGLPPELGTEPVEGEEDAPDVGTVDPPVEIDSLAAGISSPTLREALEQAEQLLREERYVSAIARYDAAERLVPNQPLVTLGRATAELGAGYYQRSALNLRAAFSRSPELLMARLDLEQMLGGERLREIAATLRERAVEDRDDDTPLFLLAFLAYNAGSYEQAGAFLDLAGRRGQDPFYEELAKRWALTPANDDDDGATRPAGPTTAPAGADPADESMNK